MGIVSAVKSQEIKGSEAFLASNILRFNQNRARVSRKEPDLSQQEVAREGPQTSQSTTQEKIERIAEVMDNYVKSIQTDLKIQVHKGTGDIMVKVLSKEDGRVIREIPSEELLNLAAKMEQMTGTLLNENA
jgi:flagellar protein FlaG